MQVFPTYVVVVLVWMVACPEPTRDSAPLRIESIHSSTARFTVQRAVWAAAQRLACPQCANVLSDFRDAGGRTIRARLDLLGETPGHYLRRITFREAVDHRCHDPEKLAFTSVGSPEVFICSTQFWRKYQEDPRYIEAVIIHEMMHTLGLGENPPSSSEISARVRKRCWSSDCE